MSNDNKPKSRLETVRDVAQVQVNQLGQTIKQMQEAIGQIQQRIQKASAEQLVAAGRVQALQELMDEDAAAVTATAKETPSDDSIATTTPASPSNASAPATTEDVVPF